MPYVTPQQREDDAWRVTDDVAHFHGWASGHDGRPKRRGADLSP